MENKTEFLKRKQIAMRRKEATNIETLCDKQVEGTRDSITFI